MTGKRQHTLNENAFESLTPEATYWVGFITADGNIKPPNEKKWKILSNQNFITIKR